MRRIVDTVHVNQAPDSAHSWQATTCSGLSNHVVNTTCCSSHSQLTHSASCRYFTSRDTGSVAIPSVT